MPRLLLKVTKSDDYDLLRRDIDVLVKHLLTFNIHIAPNQFLDILTYSESRVYSIIYLSLQKNRGMFILEQCDREDPNGIQISYNSMGKPKRMKFFEDLVEYLSVRL